jgi:hypothetical protein
MKSRLIETTQVSEGIQSHNPLLMIDYVLVVIYLLQLINILMNYNLCKF